jgi:hypothetical protein
MIVQDEIKAYWILFVEARSGSQAHTQEILAHCLQNLPH